MKRILALICVFILIISVAVMLFAALSGSPQADKIFIAAMATNIILPVMMRVILQTGEYFKKRGVQIREEEENRK